MRVRADARERELAHVRPSDDHGARRAQARHGDGVGRRGRGVHQDRRPGGGGLALDVEQVLDRDRDALERRAHPPRATLPVALVRRGARALGVHAQEGPSVRRDRRERCFGQRAAGGRALGERLLELGDGAFLQVHAQILGIARRLQSLCHELDSESLPSAAGEAKKRLRPQSLHTTTLNLALERKPPRPGR
jgi:hypothetical protein